MSLTKVLTVSVILAHVAVIVRLWPIRAEYRAFLTAMAYSALFHTVATLSQNTLAFQRFWSVSLVVLAILQIAAALELLRRWVAEYEGLKLRLLLAGGLVAFVVGGTLLYAWPSPFEPVKAASVVENSAGTGLAVYLVLVCGFLRLLYPAARPNLRRHAVLFTLAMVISAAATHIGPAANVWLTPATILVYLAYLTLSPAGEIPTARDGEGDPEGAYTGIVQAGRRFRVAKQGE